MQCSLRSMQQPQWTHFDVIIGQTMTMLWETHEIIDTDMFFTARKHCNAQFCCIKNSTGDTYSCFVFSFLDYCGSPFICLSRSSLNCPQMVHKAAARLLTKSSRMMHITPLSLKIVIITYLRLYDQGWLCQYTSTSHRSFGPGPIKSDLAFAIVASTLWDSLPLIMNSEVFFWSF